LTAEIAAARTEAETGRGGETETKRLAEEERHRETIGLETAAETKHLREMNIHQHRQAGRERETETKRT